MKAALDLRVVWCSRSGTYIRERNEDRGKTGANSDFGWFPVEVYDNWNRDPVWRTNWGMNDAIWHDST